MIVDAHTHIRFEPALPALEPGRLLEALDAARIDKALVLAGGSGKATTRDLVEKLAPHRGRLFAIGTVAPLVESAVDALPALERWLSSGAIRGLKFYTGYQHFYPSDACIRPYLELCARHRRPAIFHSGNCWREIAGAKAKYAHPLHLDDLAVEMPELTIVMAHLGNPWLVDAAEVCYKNANVYADVSAFVCGELDEARRLEFASAIDRFTAYVGTAEKLLFGSDWPIAEPKTTLAALKTARLNLAQLEQVLGGTATRLFDL